MKKELFAILLLIVILAFSLINIQIITNLTNKLIGYVDETVVYADQNDWEQAKKTAEKLTSDWNSMDSYTHIVLNHSEIDLTSEAIYEFLKIVDQKDIDGLSAASQMVIYYCDSIATMEQIRFGSIF